MLIAKLKSKRKSFQQMESIVNDLRAFILASGEVEEVYLIGSTIGAGFTEYSDIDFVIVCKNDDKVEFLKRQLYQRRPHQDVAVDFVVLSESQFTERSDLGGIAFEAKHHGKMLYRVETTHDT